MQSIKNLIAKLVGKKLNEKTRQMEGTSRTKLIAIIAVLIVAVEKIAPAFGLDLVIPTEVFRILEVAGLWTLRDALK